MRRRYKLLITACVVIVLFSVASGWYNKRKVRLTISQTLGDIQRNLPVGSPREKVTAYLDERGIEHKYCESIGYSNCEIAMIHDVAHDVVSVTDIHICFTFDQQLKLISFSVQEARAYL